VKTYIEIDYERCKGCLLCVSECPKKVIEKSNRLNSKGWQVVEPVRNEDCTGCKRCAIVCPDVAITVWKEE